MRKILLISFILIAAIPFTMAHAAVNPPSNFTATAKSACAIDLNWTPSDSSNVHYHLEYTTSTDFFAPAKNFPVGDTALSSFSHINLPINSWWDFRYQIKTVNNLNSGDFSAPLVSTPATTSTLYLKNPDDPSNLTAMGESGNIKLTWDDPNPPDATYGGFEVWRGTTPANLVYLDVSPTSFSSGGHYFYVDGSAGLGTVYYYKIRSFEGGYGCVPGDYKSSSFSAVVKVPVMPSGLTAAYQFRPTSQINLNWAAGTGQDYYEIWRATSTNPLTFLKTTITNSFADLNPESNQSYFHKVRGCTANGCSDFSNTSNAMIASAPQNITAQIYYTNGTKGNVRVSWDNTFSTAGKYVVEKRTATGGSFPNIDVSNAPVNQDGNRVFFKDDNLSLSQTYVYRVYADFGGSTSNFSLAVSANMNLAISLQGTAWATINGSGVGWVNFNSGLTPPAPGVLYSVQSDRDGLMSGAAWAAINGNEDYGWLSFNKSDLTGCPSGICEARYSSSTGVISGWARFLAPKNISNPNWSGWVSLGGTTTDGHPYGITLNKTTGNFEGAAWGGNIVGWIAFTEPQCLSGAVNRCTVSGTILNQPPVVTNVKIDRDPDAWCAETPFYRVAWDYSDPENDPQQAVDIKVVRADNSIATTTTITASDPFTRIYNPLAIIGNSTNFSVLVRATDGIGGYSNWAISTNSTTTPNNYYPLVSFSWTPTSTFATGTVVRFTDTSNSRSTAPMGNRLWEFNDANPNSTTTSPASVIVKTVPFGVSLIETDSIGNSCIANTTIEASGSSAGVKRRIFRER